MWEVCLIISAFIFITFLIISLVKNNKKRKRFTVLRPRNYLLIGTFLAGAVMFLPCYKTFFGDSELAALKTVVLSLHNTIRLFVVDSDFEFLSEVTSGLDAGLKEAYQIHAAIIYLFAPVLTFSFVLSFFKNVTAYIRLSLSYRDDLYVFSELNEKSLAFAEDVAKKNKRAAIVFTDIFFGQEDTNDLMEKAETFGAIFFKKSISAVNFSFHSKKSEISFFAISGLEDENVKNCSALYKKYENKPNCALYLFSESKQSELLFNGLSPARKLKTVRISESRSLFYNYLYENGKTLFENTSGVEDGRKIVSAVVVGENGCGKIAAKTLLWFCQLGGYRFKMNYIGESADTESEFRAECPDFLNPACNGVYVEGEAQYHITVRSGVDLKGYGFEEILASVKDASFVFIDLASDEKSVECAARARMIYERAGLRPKIVAVVRDAEKVKAIADARSTDGRRFDIDYIGDSASVYTESVLVGSELERRALEVHNQYPIKGLKKEEHERVFWSQEYSYNSSCASALHQKLREDMNIAGAGKKREELTEEEEREISVTEHCRWSAYVRSCGYVYSGSPEKSSRNDLAKTHNCLIPFGELSEEYQKIDADVAAKS